jgi:signal transduction histidine kinase
VIFQRVLRRGHVGGPVRRRLTAVLIDLGLVGVSLVDVLCQFGIGDRLGQVSALAGTAVLPFRRRAPLVVFVLTLPGALLSMSIHASLIALFTLAAHSRSRLLLTGCSAALAACNLSSLVVLEVGTFAEVTDIAAVLYSAATAAAPVFLGQLILARRDLAARLAEITEARAHEELLTVQSALAAERAQLAREMHDVVSHQVSLISVRAGALQVRTADPEAKQAAADIRRLSVRTLEELRCTVNLLRASGTRPAELTPQPTIAQLADLVAGSAVDARLDLDLPTDIDLPPPVQRAIYRTVQEGLTNIRKHAPGSTATVEIRRAGGKLRTTVTNTAATRIVVPLPSGQHGLAGLRQRAELLGGTTHAEPTMDNGFRLTRELPA